MGPGEGKETTEREVRDLMYSISQQVKEKHIIYKSTYIRPSGDYLELLINTTHKYSPVSELEPQNLPQSSPLTSLNG